MTNTDILTDMVLVESEKTATIHAPFERVDIADWLLHLPDAEYQRCAPPDHIAAGTTTTDDGRPMSINVEVIGGSLMVQHYVAEVHEPHHCRMVSISDVQTPAGWSKIQVIWDLSVTALDSGSCRYTNQVLSYPTRHSWRRSRSPGSRSKMPWPTAKPPVMTTTAVRQLSMHKVSSGRPWPAIKAFAGKIESEDSTMVGVPADATPTCQYERVSPMTIRWSARPGARSISPCTSVC